MVKASKNSVRDSVIKKFKNNKEFKKLVNDYYSNKISWSELKKHFTPLEKVFLLSEGLLKYIKTPEDLRREKEEEHERFIIEREEERERARVKRLESKLSPDELALRHDFLKTDDHGVISRNGSHVNIDWEGTYSKSKVLRLKNSVPISKARKLFTPKEFKMIKRVFYGYDLWS